jgi:hypothetical protein
VRTPALLVGLVILVFGVLGVIHPGAMLIVGRALATPSGLYVAGLVRVVIGLVLFAAAPASRYPAALGALGAIIFFAGLFTPILGLGRAEAVIEWWAAQGPVVMRLWCLVAAALGFFVAFAVIDGHGAAARRARRATADA